MEETSLAFEAMVTFVYVRDLARSREFYEGLLRIPLALDQGACHIYRVAQSGFLGVCQCADRAGTATKGVILTLVSPNVDAWYASLLETGVEFETSPVYNPTYKIYHCFFRDPDGHLIEIQRFEDPAWVG